jgi:hypothetical protein
MLIASELGISIRSMSDVSHAVGATYGKDGLILTESDLSADFFDLRTGLAGELFQKFTNYQLRLVLIVREPKVYGDRFNELAREHRRHSRIRIVASIEEAEAWVPGQP